MRRGEVWFANVPGGDRPVLVLTRDPVADRIGSVVAAVITRTERGLASEMPLGGEDGMPIDCVASFDNIHTLDRSEFRRLITTVAPHRMEQICVTLNAALGC